MTPQPVTATASGLPSELSSFVGRRRELESIAALLDTSRLLTLTGSGGSGKSRLALELVSGLSGRFPGTIHWIELSSLSDPALLPVHVAGALGIRDQPGTRAEERILAALQSGPALLILDCCEHLVEACARLAALLLRQCPDLHILATSREALGIPGERAWLVPPLSLPGAGSSDPAQSEAVQLFVERARSAQPAFEITAQNAAAVERICTRLDGIPLAIELAAARIRLLPPEQIAERLDDAFRLLTSGNRTALPRHRTLRETLDWSHALLADREQALLRRLAVFGGSFTLDAVEQVCSDAALPEPEVLDTLAALVDKSLVILEPYGGEVRYRLLDTMRQYGLEKLAEQETVAPWRARLATAVLALAEEAAPHIFGGASHEGWLRRLDVEAENLRTVAIWSEEEPGRADIALRLCTALHWYWYARGRFREGRERLGRALAATAGVPDLVRARALLAYGHVGLWQGGGADMVPTLREAATLLQQHGEPADQVYGLTSLGAGLCLSNQLVEAHQVLEQSLALSAGTPHDVLACLTRYWLGITSLAEGRLPEALEILEEGLEIAWRIGNRPSVGHTLTILGKVHWAIGDLDYALASFREGVAVHGEIGDAWGLVQGVEGVGRVRLARHDNSHGIALLSGAAALRQRVTAPMAAAEQNDVNAVLAEVRLVLGEVEFNRAWAKGQGLSQSQLVGLGLETNARDANISLTAELPIPIAPQAPREELRVRALGPLEVRCNGALIGQEKWGSAKARELLLLLLTQRQGLTKEEVGLAFWPEASTAQVRNSFHVTLHRLRRALGQPEWVVAEAERYRVRPGLPVEFDADEFEKAMLLALRSAERRAETAAAQLRQALALYQGPFLAGEGMGDWHQDTRDRLQVLASRGALALGRMLEHAGDLAGAIAAYQQLLAVDDLHEEGYRGLMQCVARQGDRPQALRLYARLANRLDRELQIQPEEETAELHARIQRGELA